MRMLVCIGIIAVLLTACGSEKARQESEKARQEADAVEAQRLAEEKALLHDKITVKREQAAADWENRTQSRNVKRSELLDQAAAEQIRRETLIIDIRDSIDSIEIVGERQSEAGPRYVFNGRVTKGGDVLKSPLGYLYSFEKKEGDLFWFSYHDDALSTKFSRPRNGVCLVVANQLKELAPGVPPAELRLVPGADSGVVSSVHPSQDSFAQSGDRYSGGSVTILKATYGEGNTYRDIRSFIARRSKGGRYTFRADNSELGGDPCPGQSKFLVVKYSVNGRIYENTWREGESVSIP